MKKLASAALAAFMLTSVFGAANAAEKITVHGTEEKTIENSIVKNDLTMVPIRDIAEALGFNIIWFGDTKSLVLWNDGFEFRAAVGSEKAEVNGKAAELAEAPYLENGLTYLPLRSVSELLNAEVVWNGSDGSIDIYTNKKAQNDVKGTVTLSGDKKVFYSQRQEEWGFENGGNGYCWVCSYAMALTEAFGEAVTPDEVAGVNKESGSSGAYMQHGKITEKFGAEFTCAIDEDSEYFEKYEPGKGATYVKAETDEEAENALREALDKNPQGVMVRYTVYPHTLYAVGYTDDGILFNEPAYKDGEYVTFDKTCLKKYNLHDFDFIQAIKKR